MDGHLCGTWHSDLSQSVLQAAVSSPEVASDWMTSKTKGRLKFTEGFGSKSASKRLDICDHSHSTLNNLYIFRKKCTLEETVRKYTTTYDIIQLR